MKESGTDRELFDLIKDTLSNYEEKYILGSWENFLRRKKRRKRLILWFSGTGIAASLLIGWLGFRFILSGTLGKYVDQNQQYISRMEDESKRTKEREPVLLREAPEVKAESKRPTMLNNKEERQGVAGSMVKSPANAERLKKPEPVTTEATDRDESLIVIYPPEIYIAILSPYIIQTDSSIAGKSAALRIPDAEKQRSDTPVNIPSAKQADIKAIAVDNQSDKIRSQRFRFGVSLSPGVTSTNTSSSINYSGGINTEFALSRKFQLTTGLLVERQNVLNKNSDNPAWIPPGQTQAELIDVDMPINLKWKFLIRESSAYYLASGISSVVYLSEKYITTNYTQKMVQTVEMSDGGPNVTYNLENVKTTQEKTEAPLRTFDIAGRVNFIVGFEHHLSSGLYLHFEPYLKIPVSELATQNLRFTTSGITCKISF